MNKPQHPDAVVIHSLGGPAKVAELLGLDKQQGGVQRVSNWLKRGIPASVKVEHQSIFLRKRRQPAKAA
jgi:hypothetical protein